MAGETARPGPLQHGFDHYLCNMEAPLRQVLLRERRLYREGGHSMIRDDQRLPPDARHCTDTTIDEAIRMLDDRTDDERSVERRVGKARVSTCRTRRSP